MPLTMSRVWAMPSSDTFSIPAIRQLVKWHLSKSAVSVDPFARNNRWATYTNDLNPETQAEHHLEALEFLTMLHGEGVTADLVIFDPPYSPRQITECYASVGRDVTTEDTQSKVWSDWRAAIAAICTGTVISCGWNTNGMGMKHDFALQEILLVAHGGWHNDTICIVEQKTDHGQNHLFI